MGEDGGPYGILIGDQICVSAGSYQEPVLEDTDEVRAKILFNPGVELVSGVLYAFAIKCLENH